MPGPVIAAANESRHIPDFREILPEHCREKLFRRFNNINAISIEIKPVKILGCFLSLLIDTVMHRQIKMLGDSETSSGNRL
jgi:hypothetical protein